MDHPILNKAWKLIVYILFWGLVGTFYVAVLKRYFQTEHGLSLTEGFLHAAVLGLLNIGTWYFIKFNRFEERSFFNVAFYFLISGIAILILWIASGWAMMQILTERSENYSAFFKTSFSLKIGTGTLLFFLFTLLYYVVIYYQKNKENLLRKAEMASSLNEMELANLKSQINPHFLFNSLNSISYQIIENPEEARESLVKLSDYFRYSLTKSEHTFSSLKDELDNVYRYLDVEKIRFGDKMQLEKTIEESCYAYQIPVMLLQPLFENCVKHGVYESSDTVTIRLDVSDQPDYFSIVIANNIDPDAKPKKGTSTGLNNVDRRLKLIYKRNDLLDIEKTGDSFKVRIRIPKPKQA